MAGAYTWSDFPNSGTANFESTARTALSTNKGHSESLDEEVYNARDGETSLDARLDEIEDLTRVTDGTITEAKLDINNAPADTKALVWNASAGKMEWTTSPSATDTGEVRSYAADSKEYLDSKWNAEAETFFMSIM